MTKFYDHLFCIYENSSFPSYSILVFTSLLLPDIKTCWLHWAMTPFSALKSWKLPLKTSTHYAVNILRSPRNVFFPSMQEWLLCLRQTTSRTLIAFVTFNILSLEQAMEVWCVNVLFKDKNWENYTISNQQNQNNEDLTVFPVTGMEGDLNADTGTSNWKHLCLHAQVKR